MSQATEGTLTASDSPEAPPRRAAEAAPRDRLLRRPSDRFRREDERRVRHRLAKQLATIAASIVAPIPDRLRDCIADLISMIWIRMTPVYRTNVMANIAQVLGPDVSERELERLAAGVFRMSARNFGELLRLRSLTNADLADLVPITEESLTALREAHERGQGVIIATAHMGAFDLMGHAIAAARRAVHRDHRPHHLSLPVRCRHSPAAGAQLLHGRADTSRCATGHSLIAQRRSGRVCCRLRLLSEWGAGHLFRPGDNLAAGGNPYRPRHWRPGGANVSLPRARATPTGRRSPI